MLAVDHEPEPSATNQKSGDQVEDLQRDNTPQECAVTVASARSPDSMLAEPPSSLSSIPSSVRTGLDGVK